MGDSGCGTAGAEVIQRAARREAVWVGVGLCGFVWCGAGVSWVGVGGVGWRLALVWPVAWASKLVWRVANGVANPAQEVHGV